MQSVSEVEAQLCLVSEELQRAQLAEQQVQDLTERLRGLEAELMTAELHRDGLRHSNQHVSEGVAVQVFQFRSFNALKI